MPRLEIASYCKARLVSRGDGAHLRRAIEEAWNADGPLVLDFANVRVASVSFFDEALGLLAREYPIDELTKRVRVENIDPGDRTLLNNIVRSRAKERAARLAESSSRGAV